MVRLSFKEKIIEHCENMERKCDRCPFKTPCDRTSTEAIPKYLTDEEMKLPDGAAHGKSISGQGSATATEL